MEDMLVHDIKAMNYRMEEMIGEPTLLKMMLTVGPVMERVLKDDAISDEAMVALCQHARKVSLIGMCVSCLAYSQPASKQAYEDIVTSIKGA